MDHTGVPDSEYIVVFSQQSIIPIAVLAYSECLSRHHAGPKKLLLGTLDGNLLQRKKKKVFQKNAVDGPSTRPMIER